MLPHDVMRFEHEIDVCVADWQRATHRWRLARFCRPTTLDPLLDRLPPELVLHIARLVLDSLGWDPSHDAYRGLAALRTTNRLLHASMELWRWALIGIRTDRYLKSWTMAVPLVREDARTLGYRYAPGATERTFPLIGSALRMHNVVRHIGVHAPELFAVYDRMKARRQLLRGMDREKDWQCSLTPDKESFCTADRGHQRVTFRTDAGTGALSVRYVDSAAGYELSMEASRRPSGYLYYVTRLTVSKLARTGCLVSQPRASA